MTETAPSQMRGCVHGLREAGNTNDAHTGAYDTPPRVRSSAVKAGTPGTFGAQLKALREAASFTQEELATIAGLSVHAISALERGERRRPHLETVRALSAALDLTGPARDAFVGSARAVASGQPVTD